MISNSLKADSKMPQGKEYSLSFCSVFHRDDGIAVIKIDEGVEVDADMAKEVIDLAASVLGEAPFALLSDRKNSYSLSFAAMSALANMPNLVALAIVIYSDQSRLLVEAQNFFVSALHKRPMRIFTDTDTATNWLRAELGKVKT
jgi:hypothetical protein